MAIALPIAVDEKLVGTCFIASHYKNRIIFLSTLHHLGYGLNFKVCIPPHGGDISVPQQYPLNGCNAIEVDLIYSDPINDIAVLISKTEEQSTLCRPFLKRASDINIGDDLLMVGYPYVGLNSLLETAEKTHISALGQRLFMGNIKIEEFVISHQTYSGSSGSPVIRLSDGVICGMVRGCLALPEAISIGNMPLGTDSNITFVINSAIFEEVINQAIGGLD